MKKLQGLKFNKIKLFFEELPKIMAERAFLSFLILLLISLIFGFITFYKYSILAEKSPLKTEEKKPLKFKEKTYKKVLEIWQEKEKRLREADLKQYPDAFRKTRFSNSTNSVPKPEKKEPEKKISEVQVIHNLNEFYSQKGEKLPSIEERAKIWEEKGLGTKEEYVGDYSQNIKLLKELEKELTK